MNKKRTESVTLCPSLPYLPLHLSLSTSIYPTLQWNLGYSLSLTRVSVALAYIHKMPIRIAVCIAWNPIMK